MKIITNGDLVISEGVKANLEKLIKVNGGVTLSTDSKLNAPVLEIIEKGLILLEYSHMTAPHLKIIVGILHLFGYSSIRAKELTTICYHLFTENSCNVFLPKLMIVLGSVKLDQKVGFDLSSLTYVDYLIIENESVELLALRTVAGLVLYTKTKLTAPLLKQITYKGLKLDSDSTFIANQLEMIDSCIIKQDAKLIALKLNLIKETETSFIHEKADIQVSEQMKQKIKDYYDNKTKRNS